MRKSLLSQNIAAYFFLIGGMVATLYLLLVFSNALWQSQRKEHLFNEFQREIERLEAENKTLAERYALEKTEQFVDKYAKANLGKVKPGEKVVVLPSEQEEDRLDFSGLTEAELQREILKRNRIPDQWWYFFFGS